MNLKSTHLAIIIFVFIFGGIGLTSVTGYWQTTNTKIPAAYQDGEFAGQYDPADIRGSYTFGDISTSFEIPLKDLGQAFGVDPQRYASFECKELESIYAPLKEEGKEVGTASVRYFVALYKGLPISLSESTYLPIQAVDILKEKASLSEAEILSLEKIAVSLPDSEVLTDPSVTEGQQEQESTETISPDSHDTTSIAIKGITTFQELLDWGVKIEDIEKILNEEMPSPQKSIKDYAAEKGIEFSGLKESLQGLIN
ncbi:MAG: hypothetical protein APF84_05545 [Gracilibacter sp. BRH_c7a]|nr:MAG: hypothetical protein APF84_05545 [Gracilibacter sp. BRH_c7a]